MNLEQITESNEAYILGLLFADGNKQGTSISLQEDDVDLLIDISKYLKLPLPIYNKPQNNRFSTKGSFRLNLGRYAKLIRMYFSFPDKILPSLDHQWWPHFIRGLFDGDGCIALDTRYIQKYPNKAVPGDFYILFNSKKEAEIIRDIMVKELGISSPIIKPHQGIGPTIIYKVRWGGTTNLIKIRNYLYKDTNLFLKRKQEKFNKIKLGDRQQAASAGGLKLAKIRKSNYVTWTCKYCKTIIKSPKSKVKIYCSNICSGKGRSKKQFLDENPGIKLEP